MKKLIILAAAAAAAIGAFLWVLSLLPKTVGKTVRKSDFREFYYTYSTTVNPPEYQRYRIYSEDGRFLFYHEKREGNKTFLTEEDITVSGELELTSEEWETFWSYLLGGTVRNRRESITAGGGGPWLYLYWDGDRDQCQQFRFADPEKEAAFEALCAELASRQP